MRHLLLARGGGGFASPAFAAFAISIGCAGDTSLGTRPPITIGGLDEAMLNGGVAAPLVAPRDPVNAVGLAFGYRAPHQDLRAGPHPETAVRSMEDEETGSTRRASGTQAVMRAVDILVAVAEGPISLPDLVARVNIPKPTCHRIASALAERGLLSTSGRSGYRLGPLLRELGERGDS